MKKRSWIYRRHEGQGLVEYGLLLALIALAVIGIVAALSGAVGQAFNGATDSISPEKPLNSTPLPANTLAPYAPPGVSLPDNGMAWTVDSAGAVYVVAYVPLFNEASLA